MERMLEEPDRGGKFQNAPTISKNAGAVKWRIGNPSASFFNAAALAESIQNQDAIGSPVYRFPSAKSPERA
jgi:phage host-nuclease inhibitor protein Gam